MLLCACCGLLMTVCECWHTELDEHRDNYEADYPYRYDPGYDWDGEYCADGDEVTLSEERS